MQLAELKGGRCKAEVIFGDNTLAVYYRPYSDAESAAIHARHNNTWTNDAVYEFLATIIVDWELMDGDKPYPHDEASLRELGMDIVAPIWQKVHLSVNPPTLTPAKKKN